MNKKLIKILTCSACGLGIAASIPFMATSCGSSAPTPEPEIDLPNDAYKYDPNDNTIITGFADEFLSNPEQYNYCNTLKIPNTIKAISDYAFCNESRFTNIPKYIENIVFQNGDINSLTIGEGAFLMSKINKIVLTKRIKFMAKHSFGGIDYCKSIEFDGPANWFLEQSYKIDLEQFVAWTHSTDGKISVINGIEGQALSIKNKLKESDGIYTEYFNTWSTKDVNPKPYHKDPDTFDEVDLPYDVYYYDNDDKKTLMGFSTPFLENPEKYNYCNTLFIPNTITAIGDNAFWNSSSSASTIPSYIKNLVIQDGDNNLVIGVHAFSKAPFERAICTRIKDVKDYAFSYCNKCKSMKFKGNPTFLLTATSAYGSEFSDWTTNGTIYCEEPTPDPGNLYGADLAKYILEHCVTGNHPETGQMSNTNNLAFWSVRNWYYIE